MIKVNVLASDRMDGAFVHIYAQAQRLTKGFKNNFYDLLVLLFWAYKDCHVIGVHERAPFCRKRQLHEDILTNGEVKQPLH